MQTRVIGGIKFGDYTKICQTVIKFHAKFSRYTVYSVVTIVTGVHCHTMNNIAEFPYDYISIQSLRDRIKTVHDA